MSLKKINKYGNNIFYQYGQHREGLTYYRCWMYSCLISCMALTDIDIGEAGLKEFLKHCRDRGIDPSSSGKVYNGANIVQERWNSRYKDNKIQHKSGTLEQLRPYILRGAPFVVSFYYSDGYVRDMNNRVLKTEDYAEPGRHKKNIAEKLPIWWRPFLKKVSSHAMTIQKIDRDYYALDSIDTNETYHIPGGYQRLTSVKNFYLSNEKHPIVVFYPV